METERRGIYASAPLGKRFLALAVDRAVAGFIPAALVVGLVAAAVGFLGGPYWGLFSFEQLESISEPAVYVGLAIWLLALALAFIWLVVYSLLRDSFGAGRSWGKRLLGLRVVEVDSGAACRRGPSALRNLPGLLSVLLAAAAAGLLPLCGLIVALVVLVEPLAVLISEEHLRIGDRWAGTRVVVDQR